MIISLKIVQWGETYSKKSDQESIFIKKELDPHGLRDIGLSKNCIIFVNSFITKQG